MRRSDVIAQLQAQKDSLLALGVGELYLFGSVARDEARDDSDVDLLVEFSGPPSFDRFMDLKFFLEDALGIPVDLVTRRALKRILALELEKFNRAKSFIKLIFRNHDFIGNEAYRVDLNS